MSLQLAIQDSVVKEPGLSGPSLGADPLLTGDATDRATLSLEWTDRLRLPHLINHVLVGGADRDRTGDLRLARAALSQLSYSPKAG